MNTLARPFHAAPVNFIRPSVHRDLMVVGVVTISTFVLSSLFELNEWIALLTVPHERYQIDELPLTILAMAMALAWFSWRRSRQAMEQVTLRLAAQQALMDSEEQYRTLFMENLSGNVLATTTGQVKLANPTAARLLAFETADGLNGHHLGEFYAESDQWEAHRDRLLRGEKIELPVLRLKNRDGVPVQVVAKLSARLSPSREPELHVYVTDITDVTLMQAELARALEENRRLSQRSMQVQEEERRSLARELHDELGQSLNAIKVDAVSIRDNSAALPEIHRDALSIIEVSSQVYDVVRGLMQRLRPVALDELGLRSAVQYGVEQWQRRHASVRCTFVAEGELDDLDEQTNITLYRLVQECLTNVAKHADATRVAVSMTRAAREVHFSFRDNGKGFDPSQRRRGLGLVGLRERVEGVAGHFELDSMPGRGVHVKAVIPAKEKK
ncbi:MAG TPA: ATP-binding protein [Burkholderiales bacterium]|nr:ATP-binding protein [Burkholderiales bacterium]